MKLNIQKVKENITKKLQEKANQYLNKNELTIADICNICNFLECKVDELLENAIEDNKGA